MDDPHRAPGDKDRSRLADQIRRVHHAGLIGVADRDIRLGNVRGAQSMLELDLMRRELDQAEATLSPHAPPVGAFQAPRGSRVVRVGGVGTPGATGRAGWWVFGVVFAVAAVIIVTTVIAVFVLSGAVQMLTDTPGDSPGVPVPSTSSQ